MTEDSQHQLATDRSKVTLLNWFREPFNNAIATARTCYSSRVILPEEVGNSEERRKQRDAIAASTYKAGHHTTLQHAHFQFILEGVSRQFLWSFLHAHPFYNSEQVSQRYVEVRPENFYVPPLSEKARLLYLNCNCKQMRAYQELIELLHVPVEGQYRKIFPSRDMNNKKWQSALKKKCMEVARYVLPVATFAHLYHTVSGITLFRYHRLCSQLDVPHETRTVVAKMINEVRRVDPEFFQNLEDELPLEDTLEYRILTELQEKEAGLPITPREFIADFDATLGNLTSKLVAMTPESEKTIGASVRAMLGVTEERLSDAQAIEYLLNPAKNPYLAEALNLQSLSKLMRALNHCHLTFRKKLSHTADSQDQRHRLTPGARPVLSRHFDPYHPDYIEPPVIKNYPAAHELYHAIMESTWETIRELLHEGVTQEAALYLLPNAFPIRFDESGDLMAFHHKWTTRLCYTAQEEIWNSCRDEVLQVKELFPEIGRWLHPPCTLRSMAKVTPYCPEGDRFCGVRVWKLEVEQFERLL